MKIFKNIDWINFKLGTISILCVLYIGYLKFYKGDQNAKIIFEYGYIMGTKATLDTYMSNDTTKSLMQIYHERKSKDSLEFINQ